MTLAGKSSVDVYVKVQPNSYKVIKFMDLFIDGKFVRRDNQTPFEWGKKYSYFDKALKGVSIGKHKLTVKVVDNCGKVRLQNRYFYVVPHPN